MTPRQKHNLAKFEETEKERFDRHKKMFEQELGETAFKMALKASLVYAICVYLGIKIIEYIFGG